MSSLRHWVRGVKLNCVVLYDAPSTAFLSVPCTSRRNMLIDKNYIEFSISIWRNVPIVNKKLYHLVLISLHQWSDLKDKWWHTASPCYKLKWILYFFGHCSLITSKTQTAVINMTIKHMLQKQSSFTWRLIYFDIHLHKWLFVILVPEATKFKFKISNWLLTITIKEAEKNLHIKDAN